MEVVDEKGQFLEYLRLASVSASEATEIVFQKLTGEDRQNLGSMIIKVPGRGQLVKLFKKYGYDNSYDQDKVYLLSTNAYIVKWKGSIGYELHLDYSFSERKEIALLEVAKNAIIHVLSTLDPQIQAVIHRKQEGE